MLIYVDLCWFWLPFGTPLAPLGSLLAPLKLPFGFLWLRFELPFGTLLARFLAPFRNLLVQHFGLPGALSASFKGPPGAKFAPKIHNCLGHFFLKKSYFLSKPASAKHRGPAERAQEPLPKDLSLCIHRPLPPGPERNLAVGNLDPLRARRRPGRV